MMLVYCARNCDTAVEIKVDDLGGVAGRIKCLECGGDANWGKFAPEIAGADCPCVDCKSTGYQLVHLSRQTLPQPGPAAGRQGSPP